MEATLEEELNAIFEANDSFQKQGFKQLFTKYVYQDGTHSLFELQHMLRAIKWFY